MLASLEQLGKQAAALTAIIGCATLIAGIVWYRLRVYTLWDWVKRHRDEDLSERRIAEITEVFRRLWIEERHALRNDILNDQHTLLEQAIQNRIYPKLDQVRDEAQALITEHMRNEEADTQRSADALEQVAAAQTTLVARFDAFTAEVDQRLKRIEP